MALQADWVLTEQKKATLALENMLNWIHTLVCVIFIWCRNGVLVLVCLCVVCVPGNWIEWLLKENLNPNEEEHYIQTKNGGLKSVSQANRQCMWGR